MFAILAFCVLTGTLCALASATLFGAPAWVAALCYVVGSWAGFAAAAEIFVLARAQRRRTVTALHAELD